ncbi:MAG: DUF6134 family protein [Proteobacteria bacterium]|nr:DUF6134 family protein [Pseudomonadota bacterium]
MLNLRSIIHIAGLLFISSSASSSTGTDLAWQFKVFLDERPIGYHEFRIKESGDQRTVDIEAKFDVKVLFVNLYRYRHQNVEIWQDSCLTGIDAVTDANGKDFQVSGGIADGGFALSSGDATITLDDCVMSFAYWNPAFLNATQLLNSQTGEYEPVTITREEQENLTIDGEAVPAVRYRVDASAGKITLWYHRDDYRWLALQSPAAGGRILRYEPVSLPAAAPQPRLAER